MQKHQKVYGNINLADSESFKFKVKITLKTMLKKMLK